MKKKDKKQIKKAVLKLQPRVRYLCGYKGYDISRKKTSLRTGQNVQVLSSIKERQGDNDKGKKERLKKNKLGKLIRNEYLGRYLVKLVKQKKIKENQ